MKRNTQRPDFSEISSGAEFNRWYWLKSELVDLCKTTGLPYSGSKFELRDRIMYALDNDGKLLPRVAQQRPQSRFNWAREKLDLDTLITDNVSFGPNFRNFMKAQIGTKLSCHSDIMDWVKAHPGKTLGEAVLQWQYLEQRKEDPQFRRNIAAHNMLSQYVRDFLADQEGASFKMALACWKRKRQLPTDDGFVRYAPEDLALLEA